MKKILFLADTFNQDYLDYLPTKAQELGVDLDIKLFDEVAFSFNKKVILYVGSKKIVDYDLIYIGRVGKNQQTLSWITSYCKKNKINLIDKFLLETEFWHPCKTYDYLKLSQANLPIIDSYLFSKANFSIFKEKIEYPCVAKIGGKFQGEGVYLCVSEIELKKLLIKYDESFLVQPFLENDGDIRVLIINNQVIASIKRSADKKKDFRNNVSLGGKTKIYKLPKDLEELSLRATKVLGYSLAGVDLIFDSTDKKWLIMEINRTPGFSGLMKITNIDVPKKIIEFLKNQI